MNPIRLIVITPEGTLVDKEVEKVFLPGSLSPFEVLKDHAPLISVLEKGRVRYCAEGGQMEEIAILSGFVEVRDNKVTVAVEV